MIVKKIKIISKLQEEKETINFWKKKSFKDKLETVQFLREQYINLFNKNKEYNASREGLRRFYKVLQRQSS
jgi:hypothetical protein